VKSYMHSNCLCLFCWPCIVCPFSVGLVLFVPFLLALYCVSLFCWPCIVCLFSINGFWLPTLVSLDFPYDHAKISNSRIEKLQTPYPLGLSDIYHGTRKFVSLFLTVSSHLPSKERRRCQGIWINRSTNCEIC
jgi:hypothetical protein